MDAADVPAPQDSQGPGQAVMPDAWRDWLGSRHPLPVLDGGVVFGEELFPEVGGELQFRSGGG